MFTLKVKARQIENEIGAFYIQFPEMYWDGGTSTWKGYNDDAQSFPDAKKPAALVGGTWTAQYTATPTFFSTQGDFHANELQAAGRTDGLQTGQIFGHYHNPLSSTFITRNAGVYKGRTDPDYSVGEHTTTGVAVSDGTHTAFASGYANRPQNRLWIIWKRTA